MKIPALYPVVTTVRRTLQLYVSDSMPNRCKIIAGELKHSKIRSATAKLVTKRLCIFFSAGFSYRMKRTRLLPMTPMRNIVIWITISAYHVGVVSITLKVARSAFDKLQSTFHNNNYNNGSECLPWLAACGPQCC